MLLSGYPPKAFRLLIGVFIGLLVAVIGCANDQLQPPTITASASTRTLGLELPRKPVDEHALRLLQTGLNQLNKNQIPAAHHAFSEAKQAAPNWPVALFYLAVCEDRMGDYQAAHRLFTESFYQDLPRFNTLWREQNLSLSSQKHITSVVQVLTPIWRQALYDGLPVSRSEIRVPSTDSATGAKTMQRAGVYLATSGHFIPAGPANDNLVSVLWPKLNRVVTVQADPQPGMPSSLNDVTSRSFDAVLGTAVSANIVPAKGYEGPEFIELIGAEGVLAVRAVNNQASNPSLALNGPWQALEGNAPKPSETPQIRIMAEGAIMGMPVTDASFNVSSGILTYHWSHSVGTTRWQATTEFGCQWQDQDEAKALLHHRVDRVTDTSSSFSSGPGAVSMRVVNGNRLLVQIDQLVYLLRGSDATIAEATLLPAGLVLTAPLTEKVCAYI